MAKCNQLTPLKGLNYIMCRVKKRNAVKRWIEKAASEMDIELDDKQVYPL